MPEKVKPTKDQEIRKLWKDFVSKRVGTDEEAKEEE
jgi:hypothetical protein